jgi:hypothetical protein
VASLSSRSGNQAANTTAPNPKPDGQVVDDFHTNADTDARPESAHHTLGPGPSQAAPGNHRHNGGDSELLLSESTITGSRGSDAWRLSINQILVRLGATDQSSA